MGCILKKVQNVEQERRDNVAFDYSKLRGRIVEIFGSQMVFAKKMGWSERTLSLKMNGKVFWKQPEMRKAVDLLKLSENEIPVYFFTEKVQQFEP